MGKLHKPKFISSEIGLGLPANKIEYNYVTRDKLITTEIWNEMKEPWAESGVIIAEPGYRWITEWVMGRYFITTKFIDAKGRLVAHYSDICSPIVVENSNFTFYDWYLDIWYPNNGKPTLLDEVDLEMAYRAEYLDKNQYTKAVETAQHILDNINKLIDFG